MKPAAAAPIATPSVYGDDKKPEEEAAPVTGGVFRYTVVVRCESSALEEELASGLLAGCACVLEIEVGHIGDGDADQEGEGEGIINCGPEVDPPDFHDERAVQDEDAAKLEVVSFAVGDAAGVQVA
jgi:hypothetical protein